MQIEPGLVYAGELILSYGTATAALGIAAKLSWETLKKRRRTVAAAACGDLHSAGVLFL